jgi:ABC-type dipeptide/oligopeptide/nickel transport system ATPase component
MRLIDRRGGHVSGSIRFGGHELTGLSEREMRRLRGPGLSLVLQSAASALNPVLTLESHFREAWAAHAATPWKARRAEVLAMFGDLNLPAEADFLARYPTQISVGQAQRVLIALAMLHQPKLLIADELTSALDLITTAEVLKTLKQVNRQWGTAILFVSHDLGAVASLCHRVAILAEGRILESAPPTELFEHPQHDYTRQLVQLFEATRFTGVAQTPANTPAAGVE